MLVVNTPLSDSIFARYGSFVYVIPNQAQMLLLEPAEEDSVLAQTAAGFVVTVWNIHNMVEQNALLHLHLNLSFLQRLALAAAPHAEGMAARRLRTAQFALQAKHVLPSPARTWASQQVLHPAREVLREILSLQRADHALFHPSVLITEPRFPARVAPPAALEQTIAAFQEYAPEAAASPQKSAHPFFRYPRDPSAVGGRRGSPLPLKMNGTILLPVQTERRTLINQRLGFDVLNRWSCEAMPEPPRQASAEASVFSSRVMQPKRQLPDNAPMRHQILVLHPHEMSRRMLEAGRKGHAAAIVPPIWMIRRASLTRQAASGQISAVQTPGSPLDPEWFQPAEDAGGNPRPLARWEKSAHLPLRVSQAQIQIKAPKSSVSLAVAPQRFAHQDTVSKEMANQSLRTAPASRPAWIAETQVTLKQARIISEGAAALFSRKLSATPAAARNAQLQGDAAAPGPGQANPAMPDERLVQGPARRNVSGLADPVKLSAFMPLALSTPPPMIGPGRWRMFGASDIVVSFAAAKDTGRTLTVQGPPAAFAFPQTRPAGGQSRPPVPLTEPKAAALAASRGAMMPNGFVAAATVLHAAAQPPQTAGVSQESLDIPTVRIRRSETPADIESASNRAVNMPQDTLPLMQGQDLEKAVKEAMAQMDLRKLSERVYKDLEFKLRSEKARRGKW